MQLVGRPIEVEHPDHPGEVFKLRKPSWIQEQDAREGAEKKNRKAAVEFTAPFIRELNKVDPDETEEAADKRIAIALKRLEAFAYELSQFDLGVLLEASILEWPYTDDKGKPLPVNAKNRDLMGADVAKWLGQHIVDMLKPPTKEEKKKA